jgi:hypothetical protein
MPLPSFLVGPVSVSQQGPLNPLLIMTASSMLWLVPTMATK